MFAICFFFFFFFFFNDTATTEIYTSFPTRRSSDLPAGVAAELLRLLERGLGFARVAGPEQADAAVELDERALRMLLAEALERRDAAVRPVGERLHDLRPDRARQRLRQRWLAGLRVELRRVVARLERDADHRARCGECDGGDAQSELEALGQGPREGS